MKSKFFKVSLGVSIILLSAGFFIRSIDVAHAAQSPALQQETENVGKYMMAFQLIHANNRWFKEILVLLRTFNGHK